MIPRTEIRQLFSDVSGVPTIWDGDPVPFATPSGICTLSVELLEPIGSDEYRSVFNPTGGTGGSGAIEVKVCGQRTLQLGVRVDAAGANSVPSYDVLELMRVRLRRRSILQRLRDNGLSLGKLGKVNDLNISYDNRSIYAAQMSVTLNLAVNGETPSETYNRQTPAAPVTLPAEDGNWVQYVDGATGSTAGTGATGPLISQPIPFVSV